MTLIASVQTAKTPMIVPPRTPEQTRFELAVFSGLIVLLALFTIYIKRQHFEMQRKIFFTVATTLFLGMLGLIFFGAMVVSTRSGMAFMDWPTSDGLVWPRLDNWFHDSEKFYEHGHRLWAQAVGYLAIMCVICSFVCKELKLRTYTLALLALIIVQGIFGGWTVSRVTPWWASTLHGATAHICLALASTLSMMTSRYWSKLKVKMIDDSWFFSLPVWTSVIVFVQLLTGAVFRNSVKVADLLPDGTPNLVDGKVVYHEQLDGNQFLLMTHMGFAMVVLLVLGLYIFFLFSNRLKSKYLKQVSIFTAFALLLQITLGVVALITVKQRTENHYDQVMAILTSLHLANAALILAICVTTAVYCRKVFKLRTD